MGCISRRYDGAPRQCALIQPTRFFITLIPTAEQQSPFVLLHVLVQVRVLLEIKEIDMPLVKVVLEWVRIKAEIFACLP